MNLCISLPEDINRELEADIKIDFSFSENSVAVCVIESSSPVGQALLGADS